MEGAVGWEEQKGGRGSRCYATMGVQVSHVLLILWISYLDCEHCSCYITLLYIVNKQVAHVLGKVHFGTMLKEGLNNWKMSVLGSNIEGRGTILGRERQEQNTQTMIM